ncbi:MAG: hypothetical protein AB7Q97_24820 [Gammaproteobacteria bacterium]
MKVPPVVVEVSAAQAAAAGLPAVDVKLLRCSLPLAPRRMTAPGTYLTASGPPGGPLGLTLTAGEPSAEAVAAALRAAGHEDVRTGKVPWAGAGTSAIASRRGQAGARTDELRVLAASVGGQGIWITISALGGGDGLEPAALAARGPYADLLAAVRIEAR